MKTTDFETSKKLKEIGFEAETTHFYKRFNGNYELHHSIEPMINFRSSAQAYDLETILEALPKLLKGLGDCNYCCLTIDVGYDEMYYDGEIKEGLRTLTRKKGSETLANTAARLLLKLVEEGIIDFKKD